MDDSERSEVERAAGRNTIFQNRFKYIVFFFTVTTGVLTIWDKCGPPKDKQQVTAANGLPADSATKVVKPSHHNLTSGHKRHELEDGPGTSGSQIVPPTAGREMVENAVVNKPTVSVKTPLQTTFSENIEFKLLSAEGSIHAQTIKMTVLLTNHAANRFIWSAVESISDADGNEYILKSFTNGASSGDNHVPLETDAPWKCTYTFGGVLPSVKTTRLFKFRYRHLSLDDPNTVEFRDIPVSWR